METEVTQQASIGDDVAAAAEQLSGGSATPPPTAAATPEPPLELPGGKWSDEHKQLFGSLATMQDGRKYQQFLLDAYKSMQGDYTRKTQEIAQQRRQFEQYQQIIQPFAQHWQRAGMAPEAGLQQILAWAQHVSSNPRHGLVELAKTYGVNLQELIEEQPFVDPTVAALQQKIGQLEQHLHSQQMQAQQAQQAQILEQIKAFEAAQDETGNPKYPYFQDVGQEMIALLSSGHFQTLEDAYDYATNGNREIRARIAEEAAKRDAAKRAAEAAKAVAPAKTVTSKSGGNATPPKARSLREDIEAAARQLSS